MLLITFSLAFIFKPYSRLISGRVLITRVDTGNWETFAFLPDIKKTPCYRFRHFAATQKKTKTVVLQIRFLPYFHCLIRNDLDASCTYSPEP